MSDKKDISNQIDNLYVQKKKKKRPTFKFAIFHQKCRLTELAETAPIGPIRHIIISNFCFAAKHLLVLVLTLFDWKSEYLFTIKNIVQQTEYIFIIPTRTYFDLFAFTSPED